MTVCLGLVCDGGKCILLAADTRGSYGSVTSNDQMAKLFDLPAQYCAAIAGVGSYCEDIISELYHRMALIPDPEIAGEEVRKCIRESYHKVFIELAEEALLNGPKITMEQYLTDKKLIPAIRKHAKETLGSIDIRGSLIVAGFYREQPVQFVAEPDFNDPSTLSVRVEITPGNALIGSGAAAALNWLNYRKQNIHFSLARSLFHLTEAKQFAEVEQTVGPFRELVLLSPHSCKPLDWTREAQNLIQGWWNKYGLPLSDGLKNEKGDKELRTVFGLGS